MAMLTDIAPSTRSLAGRVEKLELQRTSTSSPINLGSQPPLQPQYIHQDQAQLPLLPPRTIEAAQTQAHATQMLVQQVDVPIQGEGIVTTDQHVPNSNVDHH